MGSNIALPALDIKPPQQQGDPVDSFMRLKSLLGQQQIQQQQIQAGSQENQMRQMQLQDMQTIQKIAPQYVQKDSSGRPTGYDYDGLTNGAIAAGVRPQSLAPLQTMRATAAKTLLDQTAADKNTIENQTSINKQAFEKLEGIRGISDPAQRQSQYLSALQWAQQNKIDVSKFPQQVPDGKGMDAIEAGLAMHAQAITDFKEQSQGQEAAAMAAAKQAESQFYKDHPGAGAPGVPAETAGMADYMQKTGGSAAGYKGFQSGQDAAARLPYEIAKETNPAVQAAKLHLAVAEKSAEQAIADGDPKAAAQLLISGTVAPSQLISSRKPAFAQQAFTAAAQMQPGWTATKADADYKVASSPQQVAFFGSAKSLTDKGGTLDQLADAAKDIPSNQIPVFNTVADALKASTGSGPIAKYASIALGVADDYSKVMGGGQGSDTSRTQALNLISKNLSPEQRAASIEGIRGSVLSQTNSRIGNNAVLRKMYGGELQSGGGAGGTTAGGGSPSPTAIGPNGHRITVANGQWVDAQTGAPIQ